MIGFIKKWEGKGVIKSFEFLYRGRSSFYISKLVKLLINVNFDVIFIYGKINRYFI